MNSAVCWVGLTALVVFLGSPAARACNTPVFRYAMYNWAASPYRVFYLYGGDVAKEDEQVNRTIDELADTPPPANVLLHAVDVSQQEQLDQLPGLVKEAWKAHESGATPVHLVFTPWGAELFAGRLDEAAVRAMVDSPARTRLAELLEKGNAAVLVLLTCSNQAENQRAEKVLKEVVAQVATGAMAAAAGLVDPALAGVMPPESAGTEPPDEDRAAESNRLQVAMMKVDRSDAAEGWLVRTLMAVEPDLEEYAKEPMIFAAYGRGRAMEPYIGKGITADNLAEVVAFLAGPCSCMVKDQNPGVDLLVRWDWEASADRLAATDPTLDSGPPFYQEFSADSVDDPVASPESPPASETPAAASTSAGSPSETTVASTDPSEESQHTATSHSTDEAEPASAEPAPGGARAEATVYVPEKADSFASKQMWTFGIGFVAAAAFLVTLSIVVIVRRA